MHSGPRGADNVASAHGVVVEIVLLVTFGLAIYDLQGAQCFGLGTIWLGAGFTVLGVGGLAKIGIPLPGGVSIVFIAGPGVGLIALSLLLGAAQLFAC